MPFVLATIGIYSWTATHHRALSLMEPQLTRDQSNRRLILKYVLDPHCEDPSPNNSDSGLTLNKEPWE